MFTSRPHCYVQNIITDYWESAGAPVLTRLSTTQMLLITYPLHLNGL